MSEIWLEKLREDFPKAHFEALVRGFRQGVLLADELAKSTPFLSSPIGQDIHGLIRRAGIMFRLREMCEDDLPYTSHYVCIQHGHWKQLEIRSKQFRLHIHRSDGPEMLPDETPSRQDARLTNQFDLFSDPKVIDLHSLRIEATYQAWLTYGLTKIGELTHLCLGVPSATDEGWLARVNILSEVQASKADVEEAPALDAGIKLKFKEEIRAALDLNVDEIN